MPIAWNKNVSVSSRSLHSLPVGGGGILLFCSLFAVAVVVPHTTRVCPNVWSADGWQFMGEDGLCTLYTYLTFVRLEVDFFFFCVRSSGALCWWNDIVVGWANWIGFFRVCEYNNICTQSKRVTSALTSVSGWLNALQKHTPPTAMYFTIQTLNMSMNMSTCRPWVLFAHSVIRTKLM